MFAMAAVASVSGGRARYHCRMTGSLFRATPPAARYRSISGRASTRDPGCYLRFWLAGRVRTSGPALAAPKATTAITALANTTSRSGLSVPSSIVGGLPTDP